MRTVLVILAMLIASPVYGQVVYDENNTWSDSFEDYRKQIRSLDPDDKNRCEGLLRDILKGIDKNGYCKSDSDCTLIDQDPFVPTVSIRADVAEETREMMANYDASCHSDSYVWTNSELVIHEPRCWKRKCMVQTSLKK
jgi:hypothetical protein